MGKIVCLRGLQRAREYGNGTWANYWGNGSFGMVFNPALIRPSAQSGGSCGHKGSLESRCLGTFVIQSSSSPAL